MKRTPLLRSPMRRAERRDCRACGKRIERTYVGRRPSSWLHVRPMPIERMHKADPYKTKRTPKRTSLMRQADALWSQIIRLRAGRCESCGHVGALEAAHVIPRRHRSVRWDPENGHALCRACHRRYTLSEKAWRDFIGPEWDRLWSLALQPWDRTYPIALLKAALAAVRKDAA